MQGLELLNCFRLLYNPYGGFFFQIKSIKLMLITSPLTQVLISGIFVDGSVL